MSKVAVVDFESMEFIMGGRTSGQLTLGELLEQVVHLHYTNEFKYGMTPIGAPEEPIDEREL